MHFFKRSYGNMQTCEDLQKIPLNQLQELFGKKTGAQVFFNINYSFSHDIYYFYLKHILEIFVYSFL